MLSFIQSELSHVFIEAWMSDGSVSRKVDVEETVVFGVLDIVEIVRSEELVDPAIVFPDARTVPVASDAVIVFVVRDLSARECLRPQNSSHQWPK